MSQTERTAAAHGDEMARAIRASILKAAQASGYERAFWRAFSAGLLGTAAAQCGGQYTGQLFAALAATARAQPLAEDHTARTTH